MNDFEKIDSVLKFLYNEKSEILLGTLYLLMEFKGSHQEFIQIIDKLEIDKNITKSEFIDPFGLPVIEGKPNNYYSYSISFSGKLFIKNGGYTSKQKKERTQQQISALEKALLIVGGLVVGFYTIVQMFDYYPKHSLNIAYTLYLVSGFGLGLLVWLIRWLLKIK